MTTPVANFKHFLILAYLLLSEAKKTKIENRLPFIATARATPGT